MVKYSENVKFTPGGIAVNNDQNIDQLRPHEEEEKPVYIPRPKWQLVLAWVLIAIMVIAVINVCYWQIVS